jgi:hypothetical protein
LLAVVAFLTLVVVGKGLVGETGRIFSEQLSTEESRVNHQRFEAKRGEFGLQRLHPAFEAEFRSGIGRAELEADEARRGRNGDGSGPRAADAGWAV